MWAQILSGCVDGQCIFHCFTGLSVGNTVYDVSYTDFLAQKPDDSFVNLAPNFPSKVSRKNWTLTGPNKSPSESSCPSSWRGQQRPALKRSQVRKFYTRECVCVCVVTQVSSSSWRQGHASFEAIRTSVHLLLSRHSVHQSTTTGSRRLSPALYSQPAGSRRSRVLTVCWLGALTCASLCQNKWESRKLF